MTTLQKKNWPNKNWTDFLTRVIGWSGPTAAALFSVWTPADAAPLPVVYPAPTPAPKANQQDAILMTMRVQTVPARLGYYTGKIDGKMGVTTKAALRAFQRDQGLGVPG